MGLLCLPSCLAPLGSRVDTCSLRSLGAGPRSYLVKSLYTPAIKNTALQSGYWARAFTTEYN